MLIKICGNCKTYHYKNGPKNNGGCEKKGETYSPLASACREFKPKNSRSLIK